MPTLSNGPRTRRMFLATCSALAGLVAANATVHAAELQNVSRSETTVLAQLEDAFADVARRATPGIVAITVGSADAPAHLSTRSSQLTVDGLDRLLASGGRTVGTGFCVDSRGYIVTNQHVVEGARQIYVTTDDGRYLPALVIATDPRGDLAVLKVPVGPAGMTPVEFANEQPERGQWAVAIGNPIGLGGRGGMSLSAGVVSATNRSLPRLSEREGRLYSNLIQTTAELNPGNSGGPLLDLHGRVLGVITAVVLPQAESFGLGFAMPADAGMRARVNEMIRGDRPTYGYLGIAGRAAAVNGGERGLLVTRVGVGSPADGHLKPGDVILALGGTPVHDQDAFIRHVGATPVTEPVRLSVRRGGEDVDLVVHLEERPERPGTGRDEQRLHFGGVTFRNDPVAGCEVVSVDPAGILANRFTVGETFARVGERETPDLPALLDVLDAGAFESVPLNRFDAALASGE